MPTHMVLGVYLGVDCSSTIFRFVLSALSAALQVRGYCITYWHHAHVELERAGSKYTSEGILCS